MSAPIDDGFVPTVLSDSLEFYIATAAAGRATASSHTLDLVAFTQYPGQSVATTFTPEDVGCPIAIIGAGPVNPLMPASNFVQGSLFHTTIVAYISPSSVTLADAPVTSFYNTGFANILVYRLCLMQLDQVKYDSSIAPGTRDTLAVTTLRPFGGEEVNPYIVRFSGITRGQAVYFRSSDSAVGDIFGGQINNLVASNMPGYPAGTYSWLLNCVSWDTLAFRRVVPPPLAQTLTGDADVLFAKTVLTLLKDEGVAVSVDSGLPSITIAWAIGAHVDQILDSIVQALSNDTDQWYWYADEWRTFYLTQRTTNAAPWNVADGSELLAGSRPLQLSVTNTDDQLANFNLAVATQVLQNALNATIIGDGSSTTFNLPQAVALAPAITLNGNPQTVGIAGVDVGADWYWNQGSTALTQDPSGTVLTSSDALLVVYQTTTPGVAQAPVVGDLQQENAYQATSGQYDHVSQVSVPILPNDLLTLASTYGLEYGTPAQTITASTLRPGLKTGQLQHITLPVLGVDADYVIQSIEMTTTSKVIQWDYTAILGAAVGSGVTGLVQFINRGEATLNLTTSLDPIQAAYHEIVINHKQVMGASLTNFPFCFYGTFDFLRDAANGGQVAFATGSDIYFSTDEAGASPLDFDLSEYNPATGEIAAWVRIPTLTNTADTVLFIQFGDSSRAVSTANPPAVWSPNAEHLGDPNANFRAVYHFNDSVPPASDFVDSTVYGRNAANTTMHPPTLVGGLIGGAQSFNALSALSASQPLAGNGFGNAEFSFSCWFDGGAPPSPSDTAIVVDEDGIAHKGMVVIAKATTGYAAAGTSDSGLLVTAINVCDGAWHHLCLTSNPSGSTTLYVDGQARISGAGLTTAFGNTYQINMAGPDSFSGYGALSGVLEEIHFSQVELSAGWIQTEYNNQHSPTTFFGFGAPAPSTTNVIVNPSGTVTHTTGALTIGLPVVGNGGPDISVGSKTGNTTEFVSASGTPGAGRPLVYDSSSNAAPGAAGQLVPSGGTVGQVLSKLSGTNYDAGWAAAVPATHSEPLTDGNSNFIFAAGDIIVVVGVPN